MNSIIKQLPDRLANQIAAGEVIQRPASIVKELLENSVDANATGITMIIKDAGKELIQVIDNGKGMSPIDARMCFERHATSKIDKIEDLFNIRTMGFRGEALASIAAVSQVELITKMAEDNTAVKVVIEGGKFIEQTPCSSVEGTNLSVKNLFYNVPARRKFLKSNNAEWRHILEEFIRVAMAYPQIAFKLIHNGSEQLNLNAGFYKNRVVDLLGSRYDKFLIPVNEDADYLKISGFIGKPEISTRSKGNQYLFINNRFIKSAYIHHAIVSAYEGLITAEEHPIYALYFEIDPSKIDINVHPTKQEVKFEDERTIYSFVKSMLTRVLAMYNISPSLDFSIPKEYSDLESINRPMNTSDVVKIQKSSIHSSFAKPNSAHFIEATNSALFSSSSQQEEIQNIKSLLSNKPDSSLIQSKINNEDSEDLGGVIEKKSEIHSDNFIWKDYIITNTKSGLVFIHTQRAQERIIYDKLLNKYLYYQTGSSQQLLYPEMIELAQIDASILTEMFSELKKIGYEISSMGGTTYAVHGIPPEMSNVDIKSALEEIIESYKYTDEKKINSGIDNAMKTAAKRASHRKCTNAEEAQGIISQLFSCPQPEYTPHGQRIIRILPLNDIENLF